MVPLVALTSPQKASGTGGAGVRLHAALVLPPRESRLVLTSPPDATHLYRLIVDVVPPTEKSLRMSKSPTAWTPLNVPSVLSEMAFWKNQHPSFASPLVSIRSEPK